MRKTLQFLIAAAVALSGATAWAQQGKGLDVYFIDVRAGSQLCSLRLPDNRYLSIPAGPARVTLAA
jgi:hypothetical protein